MATRTKQRRASGPAAGEPFESLAFDHLTHAYGHGPDAVEAVHDLSFTVGRGEFVCVVGPSGCGKSTLFNLASGLATAAPGQVQVNGHGLTSVNPHTAYMFQHDALLDWRSVLDNATIGQEFLGVKRSEARASARTLLREFGLEDFADRKPYELSGGMRQRVALMRTYATDRPLLLLDEPFGALDALTRLRMQEFLLRRWDDDHRTVLFITHDVDEALMLGDRVIVLSKRPATVLEELRVELPRPRVAEEVQSTSEYVDMRRHVLHLLNHETAARPAEAVR